MNNANIKLPNCNNQYEPTITSITCTIASISGIWIFACVIGAVRALGYYEGLNSAFLFYNLNLSHILVYSVVPITAFILGINMNTDTRRKSTYINNIVTYIVTLIISALYLYFYYISNYTLSALMTKYSLPLIAAIVGIKYIETITELKEENNELIYSKKYSIVFPLILFFAMMYSLGIAEGKRDLNPNQSQLDFLVTKNNTQLRILLENRELIYATDLKSKDPLKIKMLGRDEIKYLYTYRSLKRKQL